MIYRTHIKKILKSTYCQNIVAYLMSVYLRFVYYTTRWDVLDKQHMGRVVEQQAGIICFWHGHLALVPFVWKWPGRVLSMVSGHADGLLIGKVFQRLGIDYTTGSSSHGGARALIALRHALRKNQTVAIVPDGPRGPARRMSLGVLVLAKLTGCAILPVAYGVRRYKRLNTWDQLRFPLPFNRGCFMYGEPFYVPMNCDDAALEEHRVLLEEKLNALQDKADKYAQSL